MRVFFSKNNYQKKATIEDDKTQRQERQNSCGIMEGRPTCGGLELDSSRSAHGNMVYRCIIISCYIQSSLVARAEL